MSNLPPVDDVVGNQMIHLPLIPMVEHTLCKMLRFKSVPSVIARPGVLARLPNDTPISIGNADEPVNIPSANNTVVLEWAVKMPTEGNRDNMWTSRSTTNYGKRSERVAHGTGCVQLRAHTKIATTTSFKVFKAAKEHHFIAVCFSGYDQMPNTEIQISIFQEETYVDVTQLNDIHGESSEGLFFKYYKIKDFDTNKTLTINSKITFGNYQW